MYTKELSRSLRLPIFGKLIFTTTSADGSGAAPVKQSTMEKMDYILNTQKYFYVTHAMHYMIVT